MPGTELLTVNGRELADFLDWEFLTADDELVIEARLPDGEAIVYEIERPDGESLGVELEPPTIRRCANRCEFCFIEGLPKGLRKPLYVRDDDYRLSFAYGNFATLSNLKERDIARILEYRLSPLYISVHATPWEARKVLLNNPRVPNIVEQLTQLADGGIQFHGQMVIVPGLNDGDVLEQSFTRSVGARRRRAVGRDRSGRPDAVLASVHRQVDGPRERASAARRRRALGRRARATSADDAWVYGSDELYLLAERALPTPSYYGDFPQIENGVGAVASLRAARARGLGDAAAARRTAHRRRDRRLDGAAHARAARAARRRRPARTFELHRRPRTRSSARRRRRPGCSSAPTFAARSPSAHDLDLALIPAESHQRPRRLSRRRVVHRAARAAADARVSVVRLHRRAWRTSASPRLTGVAA